MAPGDIIEYEIFVRNAGKLPAINARFEDIVPAGTTYIANSTKLNGTALADSGGTLPFVTPTLVQSPGQVAGKLLADGTPLVIDKEATIIFRVKISDPATTSSITNLQQMISCLLSLMIQRQH
jgi:uncharacterized repeat protein (TIGR01451 family)